MIDIFIWGVITAIGVSDAQRHRIPNQFVGVLLIAVIAKLCLHVDLALWLHVKGFLLTFVIGFVLYLMRFMAGGDVKLLAVVGLWLGSEYMWHVSPYIIVAGGVVGVFYLALHIASSYESLEVQVKSYFLRKVTVGWKTQQPVVIPFAPAIVIGLAYYSYIN